MPLIPVYVPSSPIVAGFFLVASEAILECVNSLLASGEVPGLYTHEELEPLLAPLKEHMGDAGFQFRT